MTTTITTFAELGIGAPFDATLAKLGITQPSPVQIESIPVLLSGRDLIASAPTGTGKTAAFLLPALTRLAQNPSTDRSHGPRVLVLTPTRELAQQVAKASQSFSFGLPRAKTLCITGGESYIIQNKLLAAPYEILVATPGRLMDQMNSGRIDFSRIEVLVLDEADRMLDMGFSDDVLAIAKALPSKRQTICFTATLSRTVRDLASQLLNEPHWLEVAAQAARHDAIDQHVIYVDGMDHKRDLLHHWLADASIEQAIVFTATKRDAEQLAGELEGAGHSTVALHGDLAQRQRTRTLDQLRRGKCRILVATDVAARGIDVASITHVFNFDLPRFAEDYVHRIGRTGRAGATGTAVSFVGRQDVFALKRIEQFIGNKVKVSSVAGLESRFQPSERRAGEFPGKSGNRSGRPGGNGGPRGGFSNSGPKTGRSGHSNSTARHSGNR